MVQVISNLGTSQSSFKATTVVRPVFVSIGFAIVVLLVARYLVLPLTVWLIRKRSEFPGNFLDRTLSHIHGALLVHTGILLGLVTAASYAGTSNLFAAYLAGAAISWWDSDVAHLQLPQISQHHGETSRKDEEKHEATTNNIPSPYQDNRRLQSFKPLEGGGGRTDQIPQSSIDEAATSGTGIFEHFYAQPLRRLLKPFFFASIGFSVPITKMFEGGVVWRGVIYTVLMCFGKLACGFWLVRIPGWISKVPRSSKSPTKAKATLARPQKVSARPTSNASNVSQDAISPRDTGGLATLPPEAELAATLNPTSSATSTTLDKPVSLYPAILLGLAMTARGEIGFLISALAESNHVFSQTSRAEASASGSTESQIFMVVTWAIMLCTISGPLGVGWLVRRLKRLEKQRDFTGGERDVLGVWGIQ